MEEKIHMVDLHGQYLKIKPEVDAAIQEVIDSSAFIGGPTVQRFATHLSEYLGGVHVVTCANGTDALQIALMSLGLQKGDEVIVPAFTYVASAEVIALLGLTPVLVDVDEHTYGIDTEAVRQAITPHTRAVIPVHLFGQSADMQPLVALAEEYGLHIVEDNAQAIGATYHGKLTGTIGNIGCTSFFPSKNLGCFGDGGAICTADEQLAERLRMIANHGQRKKYHHEITGCNSRLDAMQAAILDIKLRHLNEYNGARSKAAARYDRLLSATPLVLPAIAPDRTHVYHQYTVRVPNGQRDALREYLAARDIPSMVYYPLPLHHQPAFARTSRMAGRLDTSERLCQEVLSLPMHTELTETQQTHIAQAIYKFYNI